MSRSRAFVLGGTGQIGRAVAAALARDAYQVTVAGRSAARLPGALRELGISFATVDRTSPGELEAALGEGVDVLVDIVPFTREDGAQLAALAGLAGSVVAISSASVYADAARRTLDEATSPELAPRLPVPIPESHPTVAPGGATYSTRKVEMEQALLDGPVPATVIRPCAVHGPGSPLPREWFFVKRVLDERRVVVLADGGRSVFHTTSVENLAELVRLAAARPGTRILNCGDPVPPSALEIERAVAGALDYAWTEVLLPPPMSWEAPGEHPWAVPHPFVVGMARAEAELGYRPVVRYEEAVAATCAWLVEAGRGVDWRTRFPRAGVHMAGMFDYRREDELLRGL